MEVTEKIRKAISAKKKGRNGMETPRYVHGASTSCNADVFAFAAAQVKKAMEITKELNGENYVYWGGREGYETLLNTDMKPY